MVRDRKRVVLSVVGVLIIALGIAGVVSSRAPADKRLDLVTLTVDPYGNPFFDELSAGAMAQAAKSGIRLEKSPEIRSYFGLENQMVEARDSGAQAVILDPLSNGRDTLAIDVLRDAGIPFVTLGCYSYLGQVPSCVSSDYEAGGTQAADVLAQAMDESGTVIIWGSSFLDSEIEDGFMQGMAKYPRIKVISRISYRDGEKRVIDDEHEVEGIINENPDVKAVFARDIDAASWALSLGSEVREDIVVFGYGASGLALQEIQAGTMAGTIDPQPEQMGVEAVKIVRDMLDGKTPPAEKRIAGVVVDASNVDELINRRQDSRLSGS